MNRKYVSVTIRAKSSKTDIWLSDENGHLVQKETGVLKTSILPGKYKIRYGLKGLDSNLVLKETDIKIFIEQE